MKPFLELPMVIVNNEGVEKEVVARIQPDMIGYYYPGMNWGAVIVMHTGASHLTTWTAEQMDAALAAYDASVKANPGKFGNLKLTPKKLLHGTS